MAMVGSPGKITVLLLAASLAPAGLSQPAVDAGRVTGGIRVFDLAYYLQFDPVTALDLVQQTPGFDPQQQNGGRGLAGVRTNILVNGKRPPPKGQSIWETLSNQPYTSVTRIELINTSSPRDIDMQGYNQVVNVLLDEQDSNYYEIDSRYRKTGDGDVRQRNEDNAEINLKSNVSWGRHSFNLRGGVEDNGNITPPDFISIDPADPELRMSSRNRFDERRHYVQLSSNFNFVDDSSLSVTANVSNRKRHSTPVTGPGSGGAINESSGNDRDNREVSGEYLRPLGEKANLMLAVVDSRRVENDSSTLADDQDVLAFDRERDSGETAARLRLTDNYSDDLTLRAIASSAYNYFAGNLQLFTNGVAQDLEGSDSRVEEYRHSLALEADWNWTDNWILRGNLTGGTYTIKTNGAAGNDQVEIKGRASVDWQPWNRTTVSWESRYDIGQLSLGQFLASSNLSSEILQAGAVRLDSERTWKHTLSYDQRFGDRGVLKASVGYQSLENPIRAVALTDSLIVSQNSQPERVTWFNTDLEYPFARYGMEDLVLEAGFTLRDSRTIDPVTGESREVSWANPVEYSLGLRKNPGDGKWSWGMNLWRSMNNTNYGVREINRWQRSHQWRGFLQYEFFQGLRLNVRLESPRTDRNLQQFFSTVRQPGLDPSYLALTDSRRDPSARVSLQWRLRKYMEFTATVNPRPLYRSTQHLTALGAGEGAMLAREIAAGPRAEIRFRLYNR